VVPITLSRFKVAVDFQKHLDLLPPSRATPGEQQTDTPDVDFFASVSQAELFEDILAANVLDFKPFLDATCKKVADMIKGKSPEEVCPAEQKIPKNILLLFLSFSASSFLSPCRLLPMLPLLLLLLFLPPFSLPTAPSLLFFPSICLYGIYFCQIRKTFNIKNEFTPEEEERVRKENEWCEER
jgi:hypothetical protein